MAIDSPSALGVARMRTVAFSGIDVKDVDVQVQISAGLPAFTIVGLPDKAVAESRERVRSALGAMGLGLPPKRITINLAPADLESLRQPLEIGHITVARANHHITYPARFQLVAAMNPCRCGYLDNPILACARAPRCARDYQARISGPLFDRIDLHVEVPALSPIEMSVPSPGEPRATVAARVARARELQAERFAQIGETELRTNAEADGELLDKIAAPDAPGRELLLRATERMHLTARGYHRVLRVARTIADLDGTPQLSRAHIAEALSFRRIAPERR